MRTGVGLTLIVACLCTPDGAAGAILIESYVGEPEATEAMADLRGALATRGFVPMTDRLRESLGPVPFRPSRRLSDEQDESVRATVERAYEAWLRGRMEACIDGAAEALEVLLPASASLVDSASLRGEVRRAYVLLSLAYGRTGRDADSIRAMTELARNFPSYEVDMATWGPEPIAIQRRVRGQLAGQGGGTLVVETADPDAAVYINEIQHGTGRIRASLLPGRYRVYVRSARDPTGRVTIARVRARRTLRVYVDPVLDAVLVGKRNKVVLRFADAAQRQTHEHRIAARLAVLAGTHRAAVIGPAQRGDETLLAGSLITRHGELLRAAAVRADRDLADTALARFLASGERAPALVELAPDPERLAPGSGPIADAAPSPAGSRFGHWKWITLTGGVTLGAVGGAAIALDGRALGDDGRRFTSLPYGIAVSVAGLALLATSIYLYMTDAPARPERALTLWPVPGGAGLGVVASF